VKDVDGVGISKRGQVENFLSLELVDTLQDVLLHVAVEEVEINCLDSRVEKDSREPRRDDDVVAGHALYLRLPGGVVDLVIVEELRDSGCQDFDKIMDDVRR